MLAARLSLKLPPAEAESRRWSHLLPHFHQRQRRGATRRRRRVFLSQLLPAHLIQKRRAHPKSPSSAIKQMLCYPPTTTATMAEAHRRRRVHRCCVADRCVGRKQVFAFTMAIDSGVGQGRAPPSITNGDLARHTQRPSLPRFRVPNTPHPENTPPLPKITTCPPLRRAEEAWPQRHWHRARKQTSGPSSAAGWWR